MPVIVLGLSGTGTDARKRTGMRRRRLPKLIERLRRLQGHAFTRDELLLKLCAAKKETGTRSSGRSRQSTSNCRRPTGASSLGGEVEFEALQQEAVLHPSANRLTRLPRRPGNGSTRRSARASGVCGGFASLLHDGLVELLERIELRDRHQGGRPTARIEQPCRHRLSDASKHLYRILNLVWPSPSGT